MVDAFASTLEEAKDADLILHIVDPTQVGKDGSSYYEKNIEVTNKVLDDIGSKCERILVFNKCDALKNTEDFEKRGILISAKKSIGLDELKKRIIKSLYNE